MARDTRVVAVSTNPAIDRIVVAPGAADGGVVKAHELLETPGGKAAHVAMVAAALGADAILVTPADATLGDLLAAAGVPSSLVPVAARVRGTYTVVDAAAGDVLEVHEPSPSLSAGEREALLGAATAAFAGATVAVIAGSLPAGAPEDLPARLVRAAAAAGAFTVVDTSNRRALELALNARPDLVKPNAAEAAALLGGAAGSLPETARALRDRGARAAWLSAGARGSVLAAEGGVWRLAAPEPGRMVNAVGCGDALVAGLAAGLLRGLALLDAAVLGVAAATDKLAHLHSGRVDLEAVEALVPTITVERVG